MTCLHGGTQTLQLLRTVAIPIQNQMAPNLCRQKSSAKLLQEEIENGARAMARPGKGLLRNCRILSHHGIFRNLDILRNYGIFRDRVIFRGQVILINII